MLKHLRREKQLLCMARAILKRSKVLLMDEVRDFIVQCGTGGPNQLFTGYRERGLRHG